MMNAKISLKHDNVHYINKNYVFKPLYNVENECINDTLSIFNLCPHVLASIHLMEDVRIQILDLEDVYWG